MSTQVSREIKEALGHFTKDGLEKVKQLQALDAESKRSLLLTRHEMGGIILEMITPEADPESDRDWET